MLGRADKKDLASFCFLRVRDMPFNESSAVEGVSLNSLCQGVPEGVLAEDADREGIIRCPKGVLRPLNKLGEIVEKSGFHLVLTQGLGADGNRH